MLLYRGQPTAETQALTRARMSTWLRSALATVTHADMMLAMGRWFTDDLEIAQWYADDANGASEIVCVEISDDVAEAFRVSNLNEGLPGGLDPQRFSRDPEREFMLPPHITARAVPIAQDTGRRLAA